MLQWNTYGSVLAVGGVLDATGLQVQCFHFS